MRDTEEDCVPPALPPTTPVPLTHWVAVGDTVPTPPVPVEVSVGVDTVEGVGGAEGVGVREKVGDLLPAPPEDPLALGVKAEVGVWPPVSKEGEGEVDMEEHWVGDWVMMVVRVTESREGVARVLTVGASCVGEISEEGVVEGVEEELPPPTPTPTPADPEGLIDPDAEGVAREGEGDSVLEGVVVAMEVAVPPPPPPAPPG